MANLRFAEEVADDLVQALAWYDERSTTLGDRFRTEVQAVFNGVKAAPLQYPFASTELQVRFAKVKRFPYLVLFHIRHETPTILGVRHGAGDPEVWKRRAES